MLKEFSALLQYSSKKGRVYILVGTLLLTLASFALSFLLNTGLWRLYRDRYGAALIALDEANVHITQLAATAGELFTQVAITPSPYTAQEEIRESPTPLSSNIHTILPTQIPYTIRPFASPTITVTPSLFGTIPPIDLIQGNCDESEPPCLYYAALSWNEVANFLYGSAERCRWPEIADLNRKEDGNYLIPLPENIVLFVPGVAPAGTYPSMVRKNNLQFNYIPECSPSTRKPCTHTVESGMFGDSILVYKMIAAEEYGQELNWYAQKIVDANLASDCSGKPVALSPGLKIVIPK